MSDERNHQPTPYPELNRVLKELVARAQDALAANFVGAYLQGSFAVGGFDRHSDADFVIVTEEELRDEQVVALQVAHAKIFDLGFAWAKHLEGSYFPKPVLRDLGRRGERLWYLDHGSRELVRSDHDNTIVVRWILSEKGVALAGPEPFTLMDPIHEMQLRIDIWRTIHDWGNEILEDPDKINSRFYQGFTVLSFCRMLNDLILGAVESKRAGAEWAKSNLDPRWSGLIDRAWDTRPDPAKSAQEAADPADLASTLEFVSDAIQWSDKFRAAEEAAGWEDFYEQHKGRDPSDLFMQALRRFESEHGERAGLHAIDLGCGAGVETLALLDAGWQVLAIDNQPAAIEHVRSVVGEGLRPRLDAQVISFEEIEFPETNFVWAGYSLPFCKPEAFGRLWANIAESIRPGGRFAGQLFGIRDSWASEPEGVFHSAEQVDRLLADKFETELLEEIEEDGDSGAGPKHWHVFHIIARRRSG